MSQERDEIFRKKLSEVGDFRFNAEVAQVFDDMIRRSLPGYATILDMLSVLALRFAQPNTSVYDLGCSLGAATLAMRRGVGHRQVSFIAVDTSPDMVERCRRATAGAPGSSVTVVCDDIRNIPIENASLVVLNFTLQFIAVPEREALLRRIKNGLRPGGALILSEKLAFEGSEQSDLFTSLHDSFRLQNGYTDLEISQKRTALEKVLFNETEATHVARLRRVGFATVETWFRCVNFGSMLAVRE
ncbi:MAG: carboxy-S-adenosyl-L-methionine synthase CmoA [Polyangiaceae bacterium]|nr:carboxy-S-adenosyl-L-methionine synthase CmoA [Polyangiaceae bacterium]